MLFLGSLGLLVSIGLVGFLINWSPAQTGMERSASSAERKAIAVLPFENLSEDSADSYFAAGIHEEIINRLGRLRELIVISRTSVMHYKDSPAPMGEIASELNVKAVMEGSVRFAGDVVRVSINVVDAVQDRSLWSNTYEKEYGDIFQIQEEIAIDVADALELELLERESQEITNSRRRNIKAYDSYLRGLAYLSEHSPTGLKAAITHFAAAVEMDPEFSDARLYLVECYQSLFEWQELSVDDMRALSEPHISNALANDPNSARAYSKRAVLLAQAGNLMAADAAMQKAVTLAPNSARVHEEYGHVLLNYAARPADALAQVDLAAALEPLARSRAQQSIRGRALALLGRTEEAQLQLELLRATFPNDVGIYADLASIAQTGDEAMRWWRLCAQSEASVAACPAVVAGLLVNYGEYAEAAGWLDLASGIDPGSGWIPVIQFFLHMRREDDQGMAEAARRAMEYGSRASGAEYLYAHRHLRWLVASEPELVREYFQQFYPLLFQSEPQVTPRSYAAAISLAYLHVQSGEKALANRLLDQAMRIVESAPENWFLTDKLLGYDARAMIHVLREDHEAAVRELARHIDRGDAWDWKTLHQEPVFKALADNPEFISQLQLLRSENRLSAELSRIRRLEQTGTLRPLTEYL
jgi:TolB-like protein